MSVYFIQAGEGGPVKIGTARNVAKRLRSLQCAHYETLHVLRAIDGGAAEEKWLHHRFSSFALRGEWFRWHPDMLTVKPERAIPGIKAQAGRKPHVLEEAARKFGGTSALCDALGITFRTYRSWREGVPPVRARHVAKVVEVTGEPAAKIAPDLAKLFQAA